MADPKLQIDERCDRIEAALGTLADEMGRGEIVRTVLYGGGESRGEGVTTTPVELHIAHDIAQTHHALYLRLAPQYGHVPSSPTSWEEMPNPQKQLLVAIITEMLDDGVISAS